MGLDHGGRQRGEQVHLVGRDEDGDGGLVLALGSGLLLQEQQHVVEVRSRGRKGLLLAQRGGIDQKDDGLCLFGARELAHGDVAQLSVAGGVDEEELCVGARGVVVVAERGLGDGVGGGVELDGVRDLGGVRSRGLCAALEEGEEGRLAGVVGAEEEDAGRDGVG